MKEKLIRIFSLLTILSVSVVFILTGLKGYGKTVSQDWINLSVNCMYALIIVSCILILYKEIPLHRKVWIIIFGLPIDILILSVVLPLFGIRFHPIILFTFDVYVLISFSFYFGNQLCIRRDDSIEQNIGLSHEN